MDAFSLTFSSTRIINFFVISFNQRKRRPLLIALPSFFSDCNKWISVIAAILSNISIKNQSKDPHNMPFIFSEFSVNRSGNLRPSSH